MFIWNVLNCRVLFIINGKISPDLLWSSICWSKHSPGVTAVLTPQSRCSAQLSVKIPTLGPLVTAHLPPGQHPAGDLAGSSEMLKNVQLWTSRWGDWIKDLLKYYRKCQSSLNLQNQFYLKINAQIHIYSTKKNIWWNVEMYLLLVCNN